MKALRFNQDGSTLAVSCDDNESYKLFNCDPFGCCYEEKSATGIDLHKDPSPEAFIIVEMLFATSLVAVVKGKDHLDSNARKLHIINIKRHSSICELVFSNRIQEVVMNRKRLCVLLDNGQIYIYDISCMKQLAIIDTIDKDCQINMPTNNNYSQKNPIITRVSLSKDDSSELCYTKSSIAVRKTNTSNEELDNSNERNPVTSKIVSRDVIIYDTINCKQMNELKNLHFSNIASLAISNDGKYITTASSKGTVVRVFSSSAIVDNASMTTPFLFEFRRGTKHCKIHQLVFNKETTLLGCVGNTDTVHIFKLEKPQSKNTSSDDNINDSVSIDNSTNTENNDNELSNESTKNKHRKKKIMSYFSKQIKKLPNQNMLRDFAHITLLTDPSREAKKNNNSIDKKRGYIMEFSEEFSNQIYVAGDNGTFDAYQLPSNGGKCILAKSSRWNK